MTDKQCSVKPSDRQEPNSSPQRPQYVTNRRELSSSPERLTPQGAAPTGARWSLHRGPNSSSQRSLQRSKITAITSVSAPPSARREDLGDRVSGTKLAPAKIITIRLGVGNQARSRRDHGCREPNSSSQRSSPLTSRTKLALAEITIRRSASRTKLVLTEIAANSSSQRSPAARLRQIQRQVEMVENQTRYRRGGIRRRDVSYRMQGDRLAGSGTKLVTAEIVLAEEERVMAAITPIVPRRGPSSSSQRLLRHISRGRRCQGPRSSHAQKSPLFV